MSDSARTYFQNYYKIFEGAKMLASCIQLWYGIIEIVQTLPTVNGCLFLFGDWKSWLDCPIFYHLWVQREKRKQSRRCVFWITTLNNNILWSFIYTHHICQQKKVYTHHIQNRIYRYIYLLYILIYPVMCVIYTFFYEEKRKRDATWGLSKNFTLFFC